MKYAILPTEADATALQSADSDAAGLPWPAVYLDGTPAPEGQGVTTALYDVLAKPTGDAWAYPVADDAEPVIQTSRPPVKGQLQPDLVSVPCECVDVLDESWSAPAEPAPVESPHEPLDDGSAAMLAEQRI